MKRLAFNGGEVSPELALRSDLDIYHRACRVVENFDISQMGGIKRRRGMRYFAEGHAGSNLFNYEYTVDETYLVEVGMTGVWVYDTRGNVVFETEWSCSDPMGVQALQVNAIMLFASGEKPVMELGLGADGQWSWKEFVFKSAPMRDTELRDRYVRVEQKGDGSWSVTFDEAEEEVERTPVGGDVLRVGVWTGVQEAQELMETLVSKPDKIEGITGSSSFRAGQMVVLKGAPRVKYYSCIEDWQAEKIDDEHLACYVQGLSHPANYTSNFVASEEGAAGKVLTPIKALGPGMKYKKGDMLAIETAYWEYWTCVRDFAREDYREGAGRPEDYPEFFTRGIPVGDKVQCGGTWKFFCSGGWIGEYEVKRNYKDGLLSNGSEWESAGTSFSPFGANMNVAITGDESDEECFLMLFLTRSYCLSDNLEDGFPSDSCENRLIVDSYKHYVVLHYGEAVDEQGEVVEGIWTNDENMALPVGTVSAESRDWSWGAFSRKYGYPRAVELHEKRLIFAGTKAQPLTIWMSANDDMDNFAIGEQDDDGIALTIAGKTQNPICWLMSRDDVIVVGTSNAEYIIRARTNNGALNGTNATCSNSGYHGSAMIPAVRTDDRILYVQRGWKRLYEIAYSEEYDAWRSKDMTVFAAHILANGGGVRDGCYVQSPEPRAVFVLGDGTMALLTYNSLQEVNAWHRYVTEGRVTSCAAMAHSDKQDSLFLLVDRGARSCIEVIDEGSGYKDNGGNDYVSTVVTNAITTPDGNVKKGSNPAVYFYLGEETEVEGLEVSVDGEVWRRLDRNEEVLKKGWQQMVADGAIGWEKWIGLRVRGDRGLHVLAMQS